MTDEKDKNEDQEEELVPVGEGIEDEQPETDEEETPESEDEEEEETEEEEEDERMGAREDEDDEDAKRERRRRENRARRKRKKEATQRKNKEIEFLRKRNDQLERRFSEVEARVGHSEVSQVDSRITDVKSKIKLADQVISKAIESQDGAAYTEAQGIRDGLRDQLNQLNYAKTTMTKQQEGADTPPDPRLVVNAQNWMQDHSWWDPNGGDADSREVSRIDAQLVNEGYDPTTPEYWDELSDRVQDALPHRYEGDEDGKPNGATRKKKTKKKAKGGPTMSSGGQDRPLKKNEVYISPERKNAMIEAGVWDDPELRQKYLKAYAKFDREAASNA